MTLSGYAVVRRICDLYTTFNSFDNNDESQVRSDLFYREMKSGKKGDVYNLVSFFFSFLFFRNFKLCFCIFYIVIKWIGGRLVKVSSLGSKDPVLDPFVRSSVLKIKWHILQFVYYVVVLGFDHNLTLQWSHSKKASHWTTGRYSGLSTFFPIMVCTNYYLFDSLILPLKCFVCYFLFRYVKFGL